MRLDTPAPPEAKLTPFRYTELFIGLLLIERYGGGLGTPRLIAAMWKKGKKKKDNKKRYIYIYIYKHTQLWPQNYGKDM